MRADGSRLRRITERRCVRAVSEVVAGRELIAYVSNRTNPRSERSYELYVLSLVCARRLTSDRWIDDQISWSPSTVRGSVS